MFLQSLFFYIKRFILSCALIIVLQSLPSLGNIDLYFSDIFISVAIIFTLFFMFFDISPDRKFQTSLKENVRNFQKTVNLLFTR